MVSQATQADPQSILDQLMQLIDQYLAIPGDTPLKPVFAGLKEQIQGGEGMLGPGDQGAPQAGGDLASLMAGPDQGTAPQGQGPEQDIVENGEMPALDGQEQEPAKDYGTARDRALVDMKARAKGEEPQPRKRKRRG